MNKKFTGAKFVLSLVTVASLVVLPALAVDDWIATGKLDGTPHDLGALGVSGTNGEICVFCHTPHGAQSAFDGAPLWNKADANASSFTMYGATIGGTAQAAEPSSSSLACLSCHDGVSAIDSIVNAPGSGLNSITGTQKLDGTGGYTLVNDNAIIGTTLVNDHPVSIDYTDGRASLKDSTEAGTVLVGWVGATDVEDLLRDGKVECGSCHDPHNGYAPDQNGTQVNYLRYTNANSALCLGCHDK